MDFIDYRKQLNIGFNDDEKFKYFITKLFNVLYIDIDSSFMYVEEYFSFCNTTGIEINHRILKDCYGIDRMRHCLCVIRNHTSYYADFFPYYVAFINSIKEERISGNNRIFYVNLLTRMLKESHIPFDIFEVEKEYFVFPKGATEFDSALISEPLEWLKDYPNARKTFVIALKQYSNGEYIRDVADNLRKALESFLQEFLKNKKNLETNKNEICSYLGKEGMDPGISGLFKPIIDSYKNINDRIAKHNDDVDEKYLEFLLYQTGILIRMVLTVKETESPE